MATSLCRAWSKSRGRGLPVRSGRRLLSAPSQFACLLPVQAVLRFPTCGNGQHCYSGRTCSISSNQCFFGISDLPALAHDVQRWQMILVYEFMEKGTLKNLLYGRGDEAPCLSWKQRLEVCIGTAWGIHHLHTGYSQGIIHWDLKSSNILLREDYITRVSDFGLSRLELLLGETHLSTGIKGSFSVKGSHRQHALEPGVLPAAAGDGAEEGALRGQHHLCRQRCPSPSAVCPRATWGRGSRLQRCSGGVRFRPDRLHQRVCE